MENILLPPHLKQVCDEFSKTSCGFSRGREKKIQREKHPGRVAQGHKLAALMKKRKEETLSNKEQSTEQSTVQTTVEPSVQSSVQSAVQSTYVYGVGIIAVFATSVCVFFAYNTFQSKKKKQANERKDQPPKRRHKLLKNIQ